MLSLNFNLKKFLKFPSIINKIFIYLLISSLIFITKGDNLIDYNRILILKTLLIIFIFSQLNFYNMTKSVITSYKEVSILLSLFIISVTISYFLLPFDVSDFAFHWGRIRYLHTISDILLFIAFYFYFKKNSINYEYLTISIIVPGIIFSLIFLSSIIIDKEIKNSADQLFFFDGIRQVGMLSAFLICLISGYIFCNHRPKYRFVGYLFVILLFTIIFLFEGRGSFFSILFTYFFIFIFFLIMKKKIKEYIFDLIIILLISFLLSQIFLNFIEGSAQLELISVRDNPIFGHTGGRYELWEYTLSKYFENPIFGKGPGSFFMMTFSDMINENLPGDIPHTQPHNMILQFLIEWGFVGTTIILVLLIKIFFKSLQILLKYKKYIMLVPGLGLIQLTFHGMVDGTFFHPTFTFFIVLILSVISVEIKKIDHL